MTLEVFEGDAIAKFPNGHILLDDASPLIPIDCDLSEEKLAEIGAGNYELNLAAVTSKEKLEWFVWRYSSRLRFNNKNKLTRHAKKDFRMILVGMNKFPNHKLVVLVDGEDRWGKKDRVETVLNQITSLSFPVERCVVRGIKRKDKNKEWLARDHGFFIRIIPK